MKVIKNFVDAESLQIKTSSARGGDGLANVPALVSLIQYGASMSFQFSMTAGQAREMAAALMAAADEIEG